MISARVYSIYGYGVTRIERQSSKERQDKATFGSLSIADFSETLSVCASYHDVDGIYIIL